MMGAGWGGGARDGRVAVLASGVFGTLVFRSSLTCPPQGQSCDCLSVLGGRDI